MYTEYLLVTVIRLHCSIMCIQYVPPIVTDVAWSVGHDCEPCKNSWQIEMLFGLWTRLGTRNHVLNKGSDPPCEGAKMAKPIEMPFGMLSGVCSRKHVLDWGPDAAITTTTIVLQPFVQDYPGEPLPEETFIHPPSWSSSSLYQLLPPTTIHSILLVQITSLAVFLHNLFPCPLWSASWSPHIPYISSLNQCLLFATIAHTIATCFAVVHVSRLCHLFIIRYCHGQDSFEGKGGGPL